MFIRTTALTPVELRSAIVREPLVVSPDTTVRDAIAQMSGVRTICPTTKTADAQMDNLHLEARSSCVLVVENNQLLGIVTERDVVRLSAQQQALDSLVMRQVMAHPIVTLRESAFTDLFFAINLLQQHHIRHLPIVDELNHLIGLVTHESLRQTSRPIDLLRLRMVEEVMTNKVICAAPDSSMLAIAQLMADRRVSSVMIVESSSSPAEPLQIPVGIVTERDIVQFQALGLSLETYLAQAVMSTPIFAVKPDDSLWTVQQLMEQRLINRLAVTGEQGELLGIVTQTSLLQAINPLELYKLAEMLEEKVVRLETEKVQLLENLLEQEVETRTASLKAKAGREKLVADVATQIRSSLSLQTILDTTVEQIRQVLGCDRVNIWQFEADWETIAVAESTDSPLSLLGERINDTCFKQKEAEIYRQGRIRVVPDIFTTEMSDCHRQMLIGIQTRAKIIVPLLCGDELWGLLNASESQHPRDWLPEEIELLQALSVHLAIALQQATTHQKLQEELTARQRIENQLRESEERYATLVEASPVGIFRTDAAGNCIYVNDRWCQISGLNPKTATREGWRQGLHPEDRDAIAVEWYQSAQEKRPFQLEYRFQRADGVVTWVYGQSVAELDAEGQVVGYVGTVTDISDRKQADAALIQSEAHQRALITAIPDLMMRMDSAGIYLEFVTTSSNVSVVGNLSQMVGSHVSASLPPEVAQKRIDFTQLALEMNSIQIYEQELYIDGKRQIEEVRIVPYSKDEVLVLVRDISDRKLAEDALIQSEAQSRAILSAIPDFMFRMGADGIYRGFVTTNREIDFLPLDFDTVGLAMVDLVPVEIADRHLHYLKQALRTGELQVYEQQVQIGDRFQDEEVRVVKSSEDEALFMIRDITEACRELRLRKQTEEALIRSQEQLTLVLKGSNDGWWDWNLIENNIYYSPRWWGILGYEPEEVEAAPELWQQRMHPNDLDRVNQFLQQQITNGIEYYEVEFRLLHKQEHYVPVISRGFILRDDRGTPIRISGTNTDLTELKKAEEQLRQLNQQLEAKVKERTKQLSQVNSLQRAILDGADYSIISTDLTGIIQTFNAGAEVMLGYSAAEMVGKVTPAILHDLNEVIDRAASLSVELGQDIPPGFEVFVAKARQGTIGEEEWSYIRKDGSRFPVSLSVTPLKDANQQIIGFLGIAKDITERKQAELERQKLSDRLALSLKSGAIGCWEWDIRENILFGDDRMYKLFGVTKPSNSCVVYDIWTNALHPDDRTATETLIHQAVLGQAEYDTEYRVVHPDGSVHFLKASGVVVRDAQGNPQSMFGINFDITDRKQAEIERQKLSDRLTLALKSGAIGCWEWDIVQNILLWDERMYELYGVTKSSDSRLVYDIWVNGLHPDDRNSNDTLIHQAVLGQAEFDTEFRVLHPDGSIHFIKASGAVVRDAQGNPQSMIGVNFDISDRKQAEIERQQLIQELSAFKLALDQSAIVVITDTKGAITYVNDRFCDISGYSRDELIGQTHSLVHSGYHSPTFFQELWRTINSGQIWRGEVCNRTKNGSIYWVASTIVPFLDEQGQPFQYLAIRFDITDRKLAEAAIQQENTFRQQIVENMAEGLCVFHEIEEFPFLCFTVWNQQMQAITGYTLEEINRLGWYQSFYPDPLAQEQALVCMEQMREGISFIGQEREIQRKDGQKSIIALSTSFLPSNNGNKYVLVLIQDITDRKENEQAMMQQLAAIEAAIDGIGIIQGDNYIYVNQAHVELFGYQHPEELIGKSWKSFYPPEELERLEQEVFPMLERARAWQGEAIAIRKDGSTFTEGVSKTITNNGLLICVCRDISDRKQTEKALQESQQFLQTVLDTIPLPLFWKNRESVFLGCNYQLANSLDLSSTVEIVGKTDFELSTTETQALAYRASDRQVMESGEGKLGIEETLTLPGGEQKWIETHKAPLRDWENNVIGVVGMFQDITERKQAELKLQQQAEQERLLSTITQRMRSSLNLEEILNVTVQELHHVLRSDRVLVYRLFPGGTGAAIAESVSPNWPKILDIVFPEEVFPEANYDRYVRGRIYVLTDAKGSAQRLREDENQSILPCLVEFLADIQVRAKLVVPIIQNQTLWGLLIAHQCDRPRQWEDWEINLLKQTANQLAIAIQQSNLFKQLEQELIERQRAETQLTETNAQLAISNEELIRATRLKDEFLANMSHELRTPLNAILGMSEGLQEQVFGSINEPQIKALQTIDRSGSHLLELINDILDVAKIESGQMELDFTTVSINYLCQSSLTFIKQIALKKRIQLEIKLPLNLPDLLIDERRIRQVLINLLNNAVKFTPERGRITLEVSHQQREIVLTSPTLEGIAKVSVYQKALEQGLGIKPQPEEVELRNYLRIAVIDTGIGIAPENINKLFQPFIQIDSALNRQYAGTGLGLALVKRIVELHGGEVGLTSKIGVGSCFTIDLPYGAIAPSLATEPISDRTSDLESQGATPIEPTQPEQLTSPLILLAEDNEANITTFSSYLGAKGYRILLAKNGQEAIDFATTHQPNLILMDIQMPGMDGLEATRQIRRDPNLVNVPIVALTALAMTGDREKCLEAGANDYMTKPVKLKQLAATIQELLDSVKS